jgi:hypothetical protein
MKLLGGIILLSFVFAVGYIFTHDDSTAAATQTAPAVQTFNTPDEAGALITACGVPAKDTQERADAIGAGFVRRNLEYPKVEVQFGLDPLHHENWTVTGAFRQYGNDDALSRREAAKLMPCMANVSFANEFFQ